MFCAIVIICKKPKKSKLVGLLSGLRFIFIFFHKLFPINGYKSIAFFSKLRMKMKFTFCSTVCQWSSISFNISFSLY